MTTLQTAGEALDSADKLKELISQQAVEIEALRNLFTDADLRCRSQAVEIEKLRKDAERYRWLRGKTTGYEESSGRQSFDLPDPHPLGNIMRGSVAQHLDAAIDAAIQKELT